MWNRSILLVNMVTLGQISTFDEENSLRCFVGGGTTYFFVFFVLFVFFVFSKFHFYLNKKNKKNKKLFFTNFAENIP